MFFLPTKMQYLIILAALFYGCGSSESSTLDKEGSLYQVSTINALLSGIYDGDVSVRDVARHGDFGLGTFDGIDGEMVVFDGVVYQVRYDGNVTKAGADTGVPFASVHHFISDENGTLDAIVSYQALEQALNEDTACQNYPCAFRIHGQFQSIKVRSEPKVSRPYPPLSAYISANQTFFTAADINGTLIGYRFPEYFSNINVAGYHFHFLSDERNFGGHVLELSLRHAVIERDLLSGFELALPLTSAFAEANLSRDDAAVNQVER